jgi:hemolysin III
VKTSAGAESSAARLGQTVRPRLRGWLHAGAAPVVLAAGIVLVTLADPGTPRLASVLYAVTALMLFATSAHYHRFDWSPQALRTLKRLNHANIYLIIAGSYTPSPRSGCQGTPRLGLLHEQVTGWVRLPEWQVWS